MDDVALKRLVAERAAAEQTDDRSENRSCGRSATVTGRSVMHWLPTATVCGGADRRPSRAGQARRR